MGESLKIEIKEFIEREYWALVRNKKRALEEDDIFRNLRIEGDDAIEFMQAYSEAFSVNCDTYIWYFHHGSEPGFPSPGSMIWPPPDKQVERIPVTIDLLTKSAGANRWMVDYPDHELPDYRKSEWLNIGLMVGFIIAVPLLGYYCFL